LGKNPDKAEELEKKRDALVAKVAYTQEMLDGAKATLKAAPKGRSTEPAQQVGVLQARLDLEKAALAQAEEELKGSVAGAAPAKRAGGN